MLAGLKAVCAWLRDRRQGAARCSARPRAVTGKGQEETLKMLSMIETLPPNPLEGFDWDAAQREGWTLSETCDLTGKPMVQLQALDRHELPSGVAAYLRTDRAAWDLVWVRAQGGSRLHQDALNRLDPRERSMIELVFGKH